MAVEEKPTMKFRYVNGKSVVVGKILVYIDVVSGMNGDAVDPIVERKLRFMDFEEDDRIDIGSIMMNDYGSWFSYKYWPTIRYFSNPMPVATGLVFQHPDMILDGLRCLTD